jgi:hypothetical protein
MSADSKNPLIPLIKDGNNSQSQSQSTETAKRKKQWKEFGFDSEIFTKYPQFIDYIFDSKLFHQMRITRSVEIKIIDDVPAILVNGQWTKWTTIAEKFHYMYVKRDGRILVYDKETNEVYTYLDNGKGLEKFHPYVTKFHPLATINKEEYEKIKEKADLFVRPGEENISAETQAKNRKERNFVLQIVSSYKGPSDKKSMSNWRNFLTTAKHPYLRMVIGEGEHQWTKPYQVYEVGYGWKKNSFLFFLKASQGRFNSFDGWESQSPDERLVTNIPITREEAVAIFKNAVKYHNAYEQLGMRETGFSLGEQNCTSFIHFVGDILKVNLPTKISASQMIWRCMPNKMQNSISNCHQGYHHGVDKLPEQIKKPILKMVGLGKSFSLSLRNFSISLLYSIAGGAVGQGGAKFTLEEVPAILSARGRKLQTYFEIPEVDFPWILQAWQREQPSTSVFIRPKKLTIVPL